MIGGYGNENTAGVDGGGIYIEGGKVFICGQTTISYNEAGNYGGGIMLTRGELKFDMGSTYNNVQYNDVRIEYNKAGGSGGDFGGGGGGICVYGKDLDPEGQGNPLYVKLYNDPYVNLSITNNTARRGESTPYGFGGGIRISGEVRGQRSYWTPGTHIVDLNSNNRTILISNNEAEAANEGSGTGAGGGIYCAEKVDAKFTNCIIRGNKCTTKGRGGGIDLDDSQATFTNCLIDKNFADGDGGGVHVRSINLFKSNKQVQQVRRMYH